MTLCESRDVSILSPGANLGMLPNPEGLIDGLTRRDEHKITQLSHLLGAKRVQITADLLTINNIPEDPASTMPKHVSGSLSCSSKIRWTPQIDAASDVRNEASCFSRRWEPSFTLRTEFCGSCSCAKHKRFISTCLFRALPFHYSTPETSTAASCVGFDLFSTSRILKLRTHIRQIRGAESTPSSSRVLQLPSNL